MTRMADLPTSRRHRLSDDDGTDPLWGEAALRTPAAQRRTERNPERLVRVVTTNEKGQPTVRVQPASQPASPLAPAAATGAPANGLPPIERNVPLPINGHFGKWARVAVHMAPGDSVAVATANEANGLSSALRRLGAKPTQRQELDGRYRVWRLA
jgi:hypothetical protein